MSERSNTSVALPPLDARMLAAEAYVFGFPLVLMDVMRRHFTDVRRSTASRAPMNQFAHRRAVPDATYTEVAYPNADTLRSVAWIDLRPEPMVLALPEVRDRFYVVQLIDAWANTFASAGSRRNGGASEEHVIVGPEWFGRQRSHTAMIRSPTNLVCILARTETRFQEDAVAHAAQNGFTLTPMSVWGRPHARLFADPRPAPLDLTVDTWTAPSEQVTRMEAAGFFERFVALLRRNRASPADAAALARFAPLGLGSGRVAEAMRFGDVLAHGVRRGRAMMLEEAVRRSGPAINGWELAYDEMADPGSDYLRRAVRALNILGIDLPDEIAHLRVSRDGEGRPLTGASRYVLPFAVGSFPPAQAFWSASVYDSRRAFVATAHGRRALGDRDPLVRDADGALTIHLEPFSPGPEREANWLPTPAGAFTVVLRLYAPASQLFDGGWKPPRIERVS